MIYTFVFYFDAFIVPNYLRRNSRRKVRNGRQVFTPSLKYLLIVYRETFSFFNFCI